MANPAIETADLGRRYGRTWGLRGCSVTIPRSSITGLVGPNGAGKSTLLRLLAGLSRPTTGSMRVFGEPMSQGALNLISRIGYLDQVHPLYKGFRVAELLRIGRSLNATWSEQVAHDVLERTAIGLRQRIEMLSAGQQAQVALALCLGKQPDLLLLDEPAASLDPLARQELMSALLGSVAEGGRTVVVSSHHVADLESMCDYLVILSASRVQFVGTIESALVEHRLLVGSRQSELLDDVAVISASEAGRQRTLLVRGSPRLGLGWEEVEPDLEEIVRAYLAADRREGHELVGGRP